MKILLHFSNVAFKYFYSFKLFENNELSDDFEVKKTKIESEYYKDEIGKLTLCTEIQELFEDFGGDHVTFGRIAEWSLNKNLDIEVQKQRKLQEIEDFII